MAGDSARSASHKLDEAARQLDLGAVEARRIDRVALDDGAAVARQLLHRLGRARDIELQRLGRARRQLGGGKVDVAVVGERLEHVEHAGLDAQRRVAPDAHALRDAIGHDEADARHVAREPVGIVAHLGHRLIAVGLANARGVGERDAEALQEDHDLALLPSGERVARGPLGAPLADAFDLRGAPRLLLEDLDGLGAEGADEPLGEHGADALERLEIAGDAAFGARDLDDGAGGAELVAVGADGAPTCLRA